MSSLRSPWDPPEWLRYDLGDDELDALVLEIMTMVSGQRVHHTSYIAAHVTLQGYEVSLFAVGGSVKRLVASGKLRHSYERGIHLPPEEPPL